MRYSVMAGGKRLRPILVLAAADAVATARHEDAALARARALPAACALELIHTYSLIHDDLRRGRPTLHTVVGEGQAILAGDGLQAEAFHLIVREPHTDDPALIARKLRVLDVVTRAAGPAGMVGGQAIDLQAAGKGAGAATTLDGPSLADMHARKTGALIRASAAAGAVMAGAPETQLAHLDRWAAEVGLAFQIVDVVLDVEGASDALGKTSGKDAADGKPTFPALYGLDASKRMAAEATARADAALADAGLRPSHLDAIAQWIVHRRS
ncbi:MAG: polyprenyl synthetase family protein [Acidobacteria bacterium]|nr:polyprenyl synthetase family protein [Acidobacteriota bacterium]